MKSVGEGARGERRIVIDTSSGRRSPLRRLHGRAGGDDVLPVRVAASRAGHHVVERQPAAGRAAVDAAPAVSGKERPAGDLSLVRLGDADVLDEPDHVWSGERVGGGVQGRLVLLEHLRLPLEHEHMRAPNRADVQRLVARIEDENLTQGLAKGTGATRGFRRVGVTPSSPQGLSDTTGAIARSTACCSSGDSAIGVRPRSSCFTYTRA